MENLLNATMARELANKNYDKRLESYLIEIMKGINEAAKCGKYNYHFKSEPYYEHNIQFNDLDFLDKKLSTLGYKVITEVGSCFALYISWYPNS